MDITLIAKEGDKEFRVEIPDCGPGDVADKVALAGRVVNQHFFPLDIEAMRRDFEALSD